MRTPKTASPIPSTQGNGSGRTGRLQRPEGILADDLQRIIWRMEKLPREEQIDGRAFWTKFGRCIADLEHIRDKLKVDG